MLGFVSEELLAEQVGEAALKAEQADIVNTMKEVRSNGIALMRKTIAGGAYICGPAHFRTFSQANHAKWRAGLVAFTDHVEVAHLENPQRQQAARKKHRAEREQRK